MGIYFWGGSSMTVIHKKKLPTVGLIYPGRIKSTVGVSLMGILPYILDFSIS